jgi:dipeptidyl aminopeptidase/acylaminoacyl peptidase
VEELQGRKDIKHVVFDFRGEIITLPAEKGDPRNITLTTGVHETYPAWSPDGKTIAYFSDISGENMLHLKSQDGSGDVKSFKLDGTGFYAFPKWSPDSKKICYTDNGKNLYIIDLESNLIKRIDTDEINTPGPFRDMFGDWSSDSKWISYTKMLETNFKIVCLYSLDQQKSFPLTDGLSDASDPVFDPNGEYLLAVNGKDLTADKNIFSFFESTDGKITELTIGPNPDYSGSRIIKVVPAGNELSLRNRDWVEGNLKKVTEATAGQVAYVYVPNTSTAGHEYFKRYFFPQANRRAIIVDERFNGGGLLADYYIDILLRPLQSYWNMRYGKDIKSPGASIQGPKVMIIDETAGSGGDMLPWMFRKFKVGILSDHLIL